jgi:hypothetical protein
MDGISAASAYMHREWEFFVFADNSGYPTSSIEELENQEFDDKTWNTSSAVLES